MPNDRLTIDAARPGMRVVCVSPWPPLEYMQTYTVMAIYAAEVIEVFEHPGLTFRPHRFIPASEPFLAARLAAVLDSFNRCASKLVPPDYAQGYREAIEHVREEVERAGLIAQEPRTPFHLTPQQFQEIHNAG